jgi:hypothetical protein
MKHKCLDVRIRGCRDIKLVHSTPYEDSQLQNYMKRCLTCSAFQLIERLYVLRYAQDSENCIAKFALKFKNNIQMRTPALPLCLARLWFSRSMTTIPSPWRMGPGWCLWRLSWLIVLCSRSLRFHVRMQHFVRRTTYVLVGVFGECAAIINTTSFFCFSWYFEFLSSRRFAEGSANAVACLPVPRA